MTTRSYIDTENLALVKIDECAKRAYDYVHVYPIININGRYYMLPTDIYDSHSLLSEFNVEFDFVRYTMYQGVKLAGEMERCSISADLESFTYGDLEGVTITFNDREDHEVQAYVFSPSGYCLYINSIGVSACSDVKDITSEFLKVKEGGGL